MGLVPVIEDLDVLCFEARCQVGRQGALPLHGCLDLSFGGQRHLGWGGGGHG
ncbi:hypothetical protein L512_2324 [Bordetella bronchiseptica MBORD624]|nr:hypothetical protein L512_2324 [Bordetella bronchiseptica MBORD624]